MNYEKFLGKTETVDLPYLGGPTVHLADRTLRVASPRPENGVYRFEVKGRTARATFPVASLDFGGLPRLRGHHVRGWLSSPTGLERLALLPEEEPPPLALVRARRWHSADLLFDLLDFDGEAEELARRRLEEHQPLGDAKGVPATLRLAFGIALVLDVAARSRVPMAVREARIAAITTADVGVEAAEAFVSACLVRRIEDLDRARIRALAHGQTPRAPVYARPIPLRDQPTLDNAHLRAEIALEGARARMRASRHLGDGNLEVTFELMGERFISVVDALTLHVYDAGICLAGADEMVTLDSLPGVIREAIETDVLVITRR